MCGIAGIYSNKKGEASKYPIEKMCAKIVHRGPDGSGYYSDDYVSFGHRRLTIIDLTENGRQPMTNEDESIVLTFNGEIYNYKDLRQKLISNGHTFKSNSDTEVILHLYEEKGVDCLSDLRGMFAFALWDKNADLLFCARDRLGIKPFHYYWDQTKFVFASEIKAILACGAIPSKLNMHALKDYLYLKYPVGEKTFFKNIHNLEPGCFLTIKDREFNIRQYWDISFSGDSTDTMETIKRDLYSQLEESIKVHMVSDVPLGTFLSGGIDSSAISYICSQNYKNQLKTFCCGSDNEGKNSDLAHAAIVSKQIKSDHSELILSSQDFGGFMEKAIWHLDEPGGGTTAIPGYFVAKQARENVKILLSGEGADEIFGGYEFYIKYFVETNFFRFSRFSQVSQKTLFSYLPEYLKMVQSREVFLKSLFKGLLPKKSDYIEIRPNLDPNKYFSIISDDVLKEVEDYDPFQNLHKKYMNKRGNKSFVDKIQYLDLKTYLSRILHIYDRMCMATSLENRVPMLDYKLVEFGAKIPVGNRFFKLYPKYPLRMCLKNKLPDQILTRQKSGFTLPVGDWIRKDLKDKFHSILFSKKAKERGLYNFNEITRLWDSHQKGENHTERLWSAVSIELWHNNFLDRPGYNAGTVSVK